MTTAQLSLEHLIRPAKNDDPNPPVIFLLHGYGSNEEDLYGFADDLPAECCVISVRAPHRLEPFGYAWYAINFDATHGKWSDTEQAAESRDLIRNFIEEACSTYHLDSSRVTLIGFSQGTVLSYAVALSYPEMISNVVALSGYIEKEILTGNPEEKKYDHLNIYASHGQVDMVIPPEWAQQAPPFLEKLGITHVYEEFPVGHGVSPQNFHAFRNWLEGKV